MIILDYLLQLFCRRLKKEQLSFSAESLKLLKKYPWPGNVRELKNVVEWAVLTCEDESAITSTHLPASLLQGKLSETARKLWTTHNILRYRMKKHGILQK